MREKQKLVPRLRFPEFRGAGEWEARTLDSLLNYQQPTAYLVSDAKYSDTYKTPVLTAGKTFILGYTNEQHGIFSKKLPVIIFDDFTTATKFVDFPFKAKSSAMKILQANNGVNLKFVYEAMQMISYEVGTHERHWISTFASMSILAPKPNEQKKIADCLASLDDLITLESQKLDTLKTHKKGLMQQLFPAEGETMPKLRFPEFRDAGGWEEKKAGALFGNRLEDGEDGLSIYSVTMNDGMVKRSSLERRVDDIAESGGNKKARKGDIAYNMMRMWQGAFGVAPEDCMVSPAYVVLSPEGNACSDLFGYLFKLPKYLQLLTSHSQGLTLDRLRLYYKDFARIPVLIPSPLEQQKIADCLASLDNFIIAQTQKLAALKTHKKGLMQQLFPVLDEVAA